TSCFFFSSRRRHTRSDRDWSSDVCSSYLTRGVAAYLRRGELRIPERDDDERDDPAISRARPLLDLEVVVGLDALERDLLVARLRSEERRVGKGCWSRWAGECVRREVR